MVKESFQLAEEYKSILDKYPDVVFQETDDFGYGDSDVGFVKISREDVKKLSVLEKRLSLLKENFQVYESKLATLEGRKPKNIDQILPDNNDLN